MERKKYIWLWLCTTSAMIAMSYVWHGMLLTDIERAAMPAGAISFLYALFYAVVAAVLVLVVSSVELSLHPGVKGVMLGGLLGFFIYLVAFSVGLSFQGPATDHLVYDFLWQMLEQGAGGLVCGLGYAFLHEAPRKQETFEFASLIRDPKQITSQ